MNWRKDRIVKIMDRTDLFKVLLDAIRELSCFAPYAFEGAKEGMLRDKLRSVGEKLIEAANDTEK